MFAIGDSMLTAFGTPPVTGYLLTFRDGNRTDPKRHNGGSNIAFTDGHSETIKNDWLVNTNDPTARSRWNNDHQPHFGQ
jgi:prepilin-type processing-associated H-X9-DG protein